jgi:hypothetical protein
MKLISLFIIMLVACSFGYQTSNDTLVARKKLKIDQPAADNTPEYLLGKNSGDSAVIACQPESLTVHRADTAGYAEKAGLLTHGVDSGYIPVATSDTTLGSSTAKMAGDTFQIVNNNTDADSFELTGISAPSNIYSACSAPNGDCYYAIEYTAPGFYVQPGGVGAMSIVTAFTAGSSMPAMTADPDGTIYGFQYYSSGAPVHRRNYGVGSFDTIPNTRKTWSAATCDNSGLLYASTYGDTIYTSSDRGETWQFFQELADIGDMGNVGPDGTLYLVAGKTSTVLDVYKKTIYDDAFYAVGISYQTTGHWWGHVGVDKSNNIYISTSTSEGTFQSSDLLTSYSKIQNRWFAGFLPLPDSSINAVASNDVWLKTSDPVKISFAVLGGNANFANIASIGNTPTDNDPMFLLSKSSIDNNTVKKCQPESLTVDSARAAYQADESIHSDSSDTSDFAYHSPATPHEVGIDTFAYANSDTTFDGGNLFRRGDTTVVGVQSSEELVASGVTIPAAGPHYLTEDSNGDIYSAVRGSQIYKQTGGVGSFAAIGPPNRYYSGVAIDKYDSLWTCTDSGSGRVGAVFRSGDYGVTWDSLPWPDHNYSGIGFDTLGNLYLASYGASTYGGKMWIKYHDVDTLDTLSEPVLSYRGFACNKKNNDMYVVVSFGDIRKQVGGVGSFSPQTHSVGGAGVNWINCAVDTFGNAYASSANYYQFKQANGVGTFTPIPNSNYGLYGFYGVVGKANGDIAFEQNGPVYILSAEDSKIAYHIESGKLLSDGANILNHTIIDDTPDLIAGKNYSDNMVVWVRPESLSVDSAKVSQDAHNYVGDSLGTFEIVADTARLIFVKKSNTWHVNGGFHDSAITITCSVSGTFYQITNAGGNLWAADAFEVDGFTYSADTLIPLHSFDARGSLFLFYSSTALKNFELLLYDATADDTLRMSNGMTTTGPGNDVMAGMSIYVPFIADHRYLFMIAGTDVVPANPVLKSGNFELNYLHD